MLQLVAADLTQRQTLTPDMFADVAAVISCSAVKVRCLHGTAIDNSAAAGQHARAQARLRGWQLRAALVRMP